MPRQIKLPSSQSRGREVYFEVIYAKSHGKDTVARMDEELGPKVLSGTAGLRLLSSGHNISGKKE